jgi:hypothetical protein
MRASRHIPLHTLYWLAFFLALFLRLFMLGAAPLNDVEAGWALQAMNIARGEAATLIAQPAYIVLTSQLFSIFGETNFLARLFPALAGSLLVWLPCLFRQRMEASAWLQRAGVVMAFGLAVDPGLVSLSRQVASPMPAIAFTLLALAGFMNRRMILAGMCAGLALLSGPAFLQGLLILAITWGLLRLVTPRVPEPQADEEPAGIDTGPLPGESLRIAIYALTATLLVAGVLFLRLPQGLSGIASSISIYLELWVKPSSIPLLRLPASLLVYQPLVLIFTLISVVRIWFGQWEDRRARQVLLAFSIWAGVALLVPLVYAGRQVGDMAWVLVPLWALAAAEISRSLEQGQETLTRLVAAGLALLLFVLSVVGWLNLLSIGRYQVDVVVYWAIIIGALLLGFIAILLVAATWSAIAARLGLVWAICVVLGLQLFSNTWGMAVVRQNGAQELWTIPTSTGQADLLGLTLSDISTRNTGLKDQLEVVALVDSPALQWVLRNFPNAHFESGLAPTESPPAVITRKDGELPSLAEKYRGQDFIWRLYPGWQGVFPPNIVNWLAFRQAPLGQDQIILWVRADMFPGGSLESSENVVP